MSGRVFGSWPTYNSQKVVLDLDPRLRQGTAQVTVDFGHRDDPYEESHATATVAAPWVQADTIITVVPSGTANADHDPEDAAVEDLSAYATNRVPGVGFDVIVSAPHGTWGLHHFHATG